MAEENSIFSKPALSARLEPISTKCASEPWLDAILHNLNGKAQAEPRLLRFKTGRRKKFWNKNCVSIGLSSGFVEPLESTTVSLIQNGIGRLIEHFPDRNFDPALENEFNRQATMEIERIRDFIILHYYVIDRTDSELLKYCANMLMPDSLCYKMEMFHARGRPVIYEADAFKEANWISIYNGLGVIPKAYDSLVDRIDDKRMRRLLEERRTILRRGVQTMPTHEEFIVRNFRNGDLLPAMKPVMDPA